LQCMNRKDGKILDDVIFLVNIYDNYNIKK
jgi:hypothetical protein